MWKFAIGAIIGAGVLGYFTYTEGTLAFQSAAQPEEITLQKLIARGPEGNPYIVLTNFQPCDNIVQESKQDKHQWTRVWVPVLPTEEVNPADKGPLKPSNVKALLFSNKIDSAGKLHRDRRV